MGVSIRMRPGTVMRSKGDEVTITPGARSKAAQILRERFGSSPMEIDGDYQEALELLAEGASVYCGAELNMWQQMLNAVRDHGCIVVSLEY